MSNAELHETAVAWTLSPGDSIERKALQEVFGGRTQGGIGPSRRSPNVLLFSDPVAGEPHGYFDGWMPDGCFHYTGEGQYGDQRMASGNAAILNHHAEGRALRVFQGARGIVTYVDEFQLAEDEPWYEVDAPETNGGPVRKVIVFRLRPVTVSPRPSDSKLADVLGTSAVVEQVPVEEQFTERIYVEPARDPYEAERREAALVLSFKDYLRRAGHATCRLQILPPGERKPLYSDLYDETASLLVEAKGSVTREAIRMAIGQLADYARFVDDSTKVILVPTRPRTDLEDLGHSQDVAFVWPVGNAFEASVLGVLP